MSLVFVSMLEEALTLYSSRFGSHLRRSLQKNHNWHNQLFSKLLQNVHLHSKGRTTSAKLGRGSRPQVPSVEYGTLPALLAVPKAAEVITGAAESPGATAFTEATAHAGAGEVLVCTTTTIL